MLNYARNAAAVVKNRLRPVRYVYKGFNLLTSGWQRPLTVAVPPDNERFRLLEERGHFQEKSDLPSEKLNWMAKVAAERAANNPYRRSNGYPFVDLLEDQDFAQPDNAIIDTIFSDQLLSAASWYFQGRPMLTRCFLAYSKPEHTQNWSQTQLWHLDSDDFRMLRVVVYLSKVDEGAGPFLYVDKSDSPRQGHFWSPRLTDVDFVRLFDSEPPINRFLGGCGDILFIDSAQCFHCGARTTESERLALVITFTTRTPCNQRHPLIRRHRRTVYDHLRSEKPEIPAALLENLLL